MLIRFAVANFKSFAEEAEVSFVPKASEKSIQGALIPVDMPGTGTDFLLAANAIYGANASGKSNFLLALNAMKTAVRKSHLEWEPRQEIPIAPHVMRKDEPSRFEIELIARGTRHRYGFESRQDHFSSEWLYSYPMGKERLLFQRKTIRAQDQDYITSVNFGPTFRGPKVLLKAIGERVRPNSLFVSAGVQDDLEDCNSIFQWFSDLQNSNVFEDKISAGITSYLIHGHKEFHELFLPILQIADSTISNVIVTYPDDVVELDIKSPDKLNTMNKLNAFSAQFHIKGDEGEDAVVDYKYESRGVKRVYQFLSNIALSLMTGRVVIIDELETSIHPHVAAQLLALYQNRSSNPNGAQLLFTTHETRFLSFDHLRRDQIWFTERRGTYSKLYPLTDFSPRKDENFEGSYLRGQYGAIPQAAVSPQWLRAIKKYGLTISE